MMKLGKISNNLFQRLKRDRQNQHIKDLLTHANKKLTEAKRRAKSSYYQRIFSVNNAKQLWSRINELLGKRAGIDKQYKLEVDGRQISDTKEIANVFNNFFSSIGENTVSSLSSDGDINKFRTMEVSARYIFLRPAEQSEVLNIIRSLDSSKATGDDGFPIRALKLHGVSLSEIICSCFNDSICSGIYPDCLKKAIVHPIFKGGDPKTPTNYRPISTTRCLKNCCTHDYSVFLNVQTSFMNGNLGFGKAHQLKWQSWNWWMILRSQWIKKWLPRSCSWTCLRLSIPLTTQYS